jgi:hypothetical protein
MRIMVNELTYLKETASQTAGPYVHIGLAPKQAGFDIFHKDFTNILAGPKTKGEHIRIEGRVFDGSGTPVDNPGLHVVLVRMDPALDADVTKDSVPMTYTGPSRFSPEKH